ncbi:hypothetical protein BD324DRAFT_626275 [Kockovaella imperatae]|uniref:Fanconi-associated nuclease n=1 Tax=Kockovaella imperatae TaxID=4999 RepID=A0A1Y1UHB2_9TREE|nr:hypothetical protein BD324DRAFT_626275 [Kockovaella imperatae]ORX37453.1 hypothetical protein BD324DRAFT_626275 [Kockovaella imperatae]
MNSSPPPPSFNLPPLTLNGRLPITPSPTESPNEEFEAYDFTKASSSGGGGGGSNKGKGKAREVHDTTEDGGRVSMYVQLFEEMIRTVLESEEYLFTPREVFVLKGILSLPYDPKYLLTRLLLRRPGKIHPLANLCPTYSPELGDAGVRRAAEALTKLLDVPQAIRDAEPKQLTSDTPSNDLRTPLKPSISPLQSRPYPTPGSSNSKRKHMRKPWADLSTGLSEAEEKEDPELAEAIRESLWASRVGRVELDEEGTVVHTPPPACVHGSASRSVSDTSTSSTSSSTSSAESSVPPARKNTSQMEAFTLAPKAADPITRLARDDSDMSLDEIMTCVSADELRKIARARKIPLASLATRSAVETALKSLATKQTVLGFTPTKSSTKTSKGKTVQTSLSFTSTTTRVITSESLIIASLIPLLGGSAIQLTPQLHSLISRVNLIYSRTPPLTASASSLMLPSILVASHKRRYPDYGPPTRSKIWKTRDDLMIWERATHWESVVADALGETWLEQRKNPMPGFGIKKEPPNRLEGAAMVKKVWEGVWPIWQEMVEGSKGDEVDVKEEEGGLVGDRFRTGHVLTRIVYKSAVALGILHEYDLECEMLKALLNQRRWRRSKRGAWYERLALVLMNHYNASPEEKEEKMREATQVCIDGLLDEDTHLIYRPGLSRRLTRLENKLNLPNDERHISHAELLKCETRELSAPRVPENLGAPKARPRADPARERDREASLGLDDGSERPWTFQQTGKSVWVGRESEVTVEGWVLEWWEKKGYKGYHSEGSILTTLFALLMWPILFHPLPGSFETPYQTAPLDLGEDTFAPARLELIESRLNAMTKTTNALEMLRETDGAQREKQTWAVGLNWEYEKDDLEELVQCLGGKALSVICRMLAEEYRHRVSGVPDLIVWKFDTREARFIEVKGPGDSLSETQKIWIDVLLSAGVPVEVCKVKAKDHEASRSAMERLAKRKASAVSKEVQAKSAKRIKKDRGEQDDDEMAMMEMERGEGVDADENGDDDDDGDQEDEDDEWKYESGDEGKGEGRWERSVAKRKKGKP